MIKRLLSKILILILLLNVNLIGMTGAYLSDTERSNGSTFTAGSVDLSLKDTGGVVLASPFFNISGMKPGDSETKTVKVTKEGALDFQYSVKATKTGGDDNLCNALKIDAKLDGVSQYNNNLTGLNLNPAATISGGQDTWDFTVRLESADAGLQSKTCSFDLIVKGWQVGSNGTWGLMDTESLVNSAATGTWDTAGSVVINEIMWMGSTLSSADEWIEFRNTTGNPIDLTGWKIEGAGDSSNPDITLSGSIPADGYFLLANYPTNHVSSAINNSITANIDTTSLELDNSGEQLTLKSSIGVTIDQTPSGAWATGTHTSPATVEQSMERNDDPSTGWHTCEAIACNDTTYWDAEGDNYGTPKAVNLSENDPSATVSSVSEESGKAEVAEVAETEAIVTPTPNPDVQENASESGEVINNPAIEEEKEGPIGEVIPTEAPAEEPEPEATPEVIIEEPQVEVQEDAQQESVSEQEQPPQPVISEETINE